jgi:hypothetical protein
MARHHGGDKVTGGFYLNLISWEITTISGREGGRLDGDAAVVYRRIPVIAMLLIAPLLGAAFAIFLPFIGIALVIGYAAQRGWNGVRGLAHSLVATLGPAWQPATSHLSGAPDAQKDSVKTEDQGAHPALDKLEREIEQRADDESAPRG